MIEVPPGQRRWAVGEVVEHVTDLGVADVVSAEVVHLGRRGPTLRARRSDGQLVAIKVGAQLRSSGARRKFPEEAAVLRRLPASPFVVPVLDAGVTPDGCPWLLCPWRDGGSQAERIPLPADAAIGVGGQSATGLAVLHGAEVLHGNLTPANLLIDAYGETAVDGMALASLAPVLAGPRPGTAPAHVPPEVLEAGAWSVAGDLWALGSCLHTILTGRPPWASQSEQGVARLLLAIANREPPGIWPPGTPVWLQELLVDCLAGDIATRPASAAEVGARLHDRRGSLHTLAPAPPVQGRPLGSRYLLLEPIGAGASGQVWRAERRWDGAAVAVKVLRPELTLDPEAVARFLRERTTLVGLQDPNLVSVLDLVAEGTTLAIVMDLVNGPDLRRILVDRGPLAPREACLLLAQVSTALAATHRAGVVHRDLKPENVLVEHAGTREARARVTDFGIARTAGGATITRVNQLAGTAEYLAPELVAGRQLAPPVDVYSLGVLAYEMLSGHRPFEGEHPAAVLRAQLDLEPRRPDGLAEPLWDTVRRCLAKDPAARPTAEMAAAEWVELGRTCDPIPALDRPSERPAIARAVGPAGASINALSAAGPSCAPSGASGPPVQFEQGRPQPSLAPGAEPSGPGHTRQYSRPWRPVDDASPEAAPPRRRRLWPIVTIAAVVVISAGAGLAVALNRSPAPPAPATSADVTLSVAATPARAVTVTWADVTSRAGFITYVLYDGNRITSPQPSPGATQANLDEVSPGTHCYRAVAVFRGPLPSGLPSAAIGKECLTVP